MSPGRRRSSDRRGPARVDDGPGEEAERQPPRRSWCACRERQRAEQPGEPQSRTRLRPGSIDHAADNAPHKTRRRGSPPGGAGPKSWAGRLRSAGRAARRTRPAARRRAARGRAAAAAPARRNEPFAPGARQRQPASRGRTSSAVAKRPI
jgi:hypothetical protein